MLTRLHIKGFKNLRDVDLRFGPFTCIAGPNGVGKSNLFDAILFISNLASMSVARAASIARGTNGRAADFACLFYKDKFGEADRIEFTVEMIVPPRVQDDFDRAVKPQATFVEYSLVLRLNADSTSGKSKEPIYIESEFLRAKPSSDAPKLLEFSPAPELLKKFVFGPGNRTQPFIETKGEGDGAVIVLRGSGQTGRPPEVPAHRTPQTVLSGVNSIAYSTVLAARREMQSWRLMQLEPSSLRSPDDFRDEQQISPAGAHLPNTLARLKKNGEVASRLAELLPDVRSIEIDEDDKRELRTVFVNTRDGQRYSAGSLSDGTLRFLALAVIASDVDANGLICMEEPENGIHPLRIPEMLGLVRSLSDADSEKSDWAERSALRQVIINTHSPLVVAELPDDELLMAQTFRFKGSTYLDFKCLEDTWRARSVDSVRAKLISRGELLAYLQGGRVMSGAKRRRVIDHFDIAVRQQELFTADAGAAG
jgi:predicted ATPase